MRLIINAKKAKVAWSVVCRPTREGGLGIRSLEDVNTVCVLKLVWRIVSVPNSMWVRWINANLIKGKTIWSIKESTSSGSWMWHKILKYRDKAQVFHRKEVRSGMSTSFWYDTWSSLGQLYNRIGSRGVIDLGISCNATVAEVLDMRRRRRHRADFLNQIEAAIQTVRESRNGEADLSLWKQNDDSFKEKFSSHHTWNQIRVIHHSCDWYKGVWFSFSTPKYAFMTWLAFQDRLATGDMIRSWNAGSQSGCVFCGEDLETRNHLFFSCSFSSHVWSVLTRGLLRERYTTSWSSIVPILLDETQPKLFAFTLRYVFQISLHSLWRERNGRRHGDAPIPAAKLAQLIDKHVRNRFSTLRATGKFEEGLRYWFQTRNT